MNKKIQPIITAMTIIVFWGMALACKPELERKVPCEKLGSPVTKTQFVNIKLLDAVSKLPIKNAPVILYEYQTTIVFPSNPEESCQSKISKNGSKTEVTNENGIAVFALSKTYVSPYELIDVSIRAEAQSYEIQNHVFTLTHTSSDKSKTILLIKKTIYP